LKQIAFLSNGFWYNAYGNYSGGKLTIWFRW